MVGDDLLCRFSESEVIAQDQVGLMRSSCIWSGQFCGWWVRDGLRFTKELGRPDAELWSMVRCRVMSSKQSIDLLIHWFGSGELKKISSSFLLMVKGDTFVPVKFEKTRSNPTGKFYAGSATTGRYSYQDLLDGMVVMHRLDAKRLPKFLSCVDWTGFGPSDKALVERVIEHGVAALAG
jgi:hypothetical protein